MPERDAGILARSLEATGVAVERVLLVGDRLPALVGALAALLGEEMDLVCVSGGLGSTHDDLTMAAVARATGRPLTLDEAALRMVRAAGSARGVPAGTARAAQEKQATLPAGAVPIPPAGTAPGCLLAEAGSVVVVLPGPPWELRAAWATARGMSPLAELLAGARPPDERVLRIFATPEPRVVAVLDRLGPRALDGLELGICARDAELELAIRAAPGAGAERDALEGALAAELGGALYSRDGTDVDTVVARLLDDAGQTVAVAESCTGGGLGARLTAGAGASRRFRGGVVAYADPVKAALLDVDPGLLARHGAVSAECARAMAAGARARVGTDWALSVTGVAGPEGGTPDTPVGLVYLGLAGPDRVVAEEHRMRGDRAAIRARSAAYALHLLRRALAGEA